MIETKEVQKVKFIKLNDWTVLPFKPVPEKIETNSSQNMRYVSNQRVKGMCWPYVAAQNIGWIVKSPIDINIEPVEEYQIKCTEEQLQEIGAMLEIDHWVKRGNIFLGLKPNGWFRLHQAFINGIWQNLLIPNGEKSFEWRLGWGVECPEDFILMILPIDSQEKIKVHPGVLTNKSLFDFNNNGLGLSLAMEPLKKATIKKNEPIARIMVVHKSVLNIKEEIMDLV